MSDSNPGKLNYQISDREPKVVKRPGVRGVQKMIEDHREKTGETLYTITQASELTGVPVPTLRSWYNSPTSPITAPSRQVTYGTSKVVYLYTEDDITSIKNYVGDKTKEQES